MIHSRINMRFSIFVFVFLTSLSACKKENSTNSSSNTSSGTTTGGGGSQGITNTVDCYVTLYDSLGGYESDKSNVIVSLPGVLQSVITNTFGHASFLGIAAGTVQPALSKSGYDYASQKFVFAATQPFSFNTFMAKHSPYKLTLTNFSLVNKDSIALNFFLNKTIPSGKNVKIAVLAGDAASTSVNNFKAVDFFNVSGSNTNFTNKNIAKLFGIDTYLNASIANGQKCYFVVVPVSYGVITSNVTSKDVLIGENVPIQGSPTATFQITKNW
jgi:hypothetical protein